MTGMRPCVDRTLASVEHGLNIAGYIPLFGVSTVSGMIRIAYGKLEIIGGVATSAIMGLAALFKSGERERERGLREAFETFGNYSCHGLANIARGVIEAIPFLSLITCLPYDLMGYRFTYLPNEQRHYRGYLPSI
jgi:hypothetical protein